MPLFLCLRLHGITSGKCHQPCDCTHGKAVWNEPPSDAVSGFPPEAPADVATGMLLGIVIPKMHDFGLNNPTCKMG